MNYDNKVTILVSSCDLYEDAWMPFFTLLHKQWKECPYPSVLSTETKVYNCDFMDIKTINSGKNLSWTERLRDALNHIDSDYVLWFLEDFFLQDRVDVNAFNIALDIIENNSDVGMVHFVPSEKEMPEPANDLEHCFYELPVRKRTFRTRVAVTLFRKEYFLKLLFKDESPWQYERESHIRSMFAGYKIIRQDYAKYPPVFKYTLDHDIGIGITSRKWLEKTPEFLELNGINNVNYDNLGILTINEEKQIVNSGVKKVGFRQWIYLKIEHPIKRKLRHVWLVQDILNMNKYIKYWRYYRELSKK